LGITNLPAASLDCYVVATSHPSTASFRTLLWIAAGIHPLLLEVGTNRCGAYNASFKYSGVDVPPSTKALYKVSIDASGNTAIGVNGAALSAALTIFSQAIGIIGNDGQATQPFGSMHELIVTSNLDTQHSQTVEGNLAWKWGIQASLPSNHPFKSAKP
jgi:hypothetical protein